eukprot:15159247-Ditylum_brightwellii.AAC.1
MLSATTQEFNHVGTAKKGNISKVADQTQNAEEADVRAIQQKDRDKEGNLYSNLMIRHLWKTQVDTVIDMRITDTDVKSHILRPLDTLLTAQEKEKREIFKCISGTELTFLTICCLC